MIVETNIQNTELTVYTVPEQKKAMIEIIITPLNICEVYAKINEKILFDEVIEEQISQKLICLSGDVVRIGTDGKINVFVSGMEV